MAPGFSPYTKLELEHNISTYHASSFWTQNLFPPGFYLLVRNGMTKIRVKLRITLYGYHSAPEARATLEWLRFCVTKSFNVWKCMEIRNLMGQWISMQTTGELTKPITRHEAYCRRVLLNTTQRKTGFPRQRELSITHLKRYLLFF